ncbi:permease prefix domain 1-containing protein [Clostridium sporogenes]|uniref:Permease prefix domain 1-containing protein n=1 Tax=Clostridium sporogenes TaxID=1509 RepID=A0AAE4JRM3_CLOSG|nr:permease prefix domain 1-containing protein [Clostridium sporogenes]MDS1002346.1 permease prefix domain 1-containing protein [Clostridium sporogenes]
MKENEYLLILSKNISNKKMRKEICMEMKDHITDQKEAYIKMGYSNEDAEKAAVKDMGDPKTAGMMLDSIHPPTIDWIQIIALILITLSLQVLKHMSELAGSNFAAIAPIDIIRILGIILLVYGVIWIGIEKYSNLPFFYGKSQHGGSNANGVFVCSLGIVMISHSLLQTIILICIFATIIAVERAIIESKRIKKEQKFLYQQGVASENFNYKGKGLFENTLQRVYSKNESIKKGDPIMIMSLDGFNLIVKKTKS